MRAAANWWRGPEPWFRSRPLVSLGVTVTMFVVVVVLELVESGSEHDYTMLYILPVALASATFGLRGGLAAGVASVFFTGFAVTAQSMTLTAMDWASHGIPILLLGLVLGDAADRLHRSEVVRRRLESAALLHREAIELNDSVLQGMEAAKWSFEADRTDAGLRILEETIARAQQLVSSLIRRGDMAARSESLAPMLGVPRDRASAASREANSAHRWRPGEQARAGIPGGTSWSKYTN